jgi:hypothetical protein
MFLVQKKESFIGELNVLQYKAQNPNFKQELLKNPIKLTKKLFKTSSSIKEKMKKRHNQYYKQKISPLWKFGKYYNKYRAHQLTDKTIMYDVIKELNIPLPRKYYDGQFVNINWETIPSKCVIKPTTLHSAQGVYLFDNDIEKTTGKKILYSDRKKFILNDLGNQVNKCNWVIEEYLEDYDSNYDRARDFKCYVGGGKVWFVLVYERNKQNNKAKHYTRNWLPIKNVWGNYKSAKTVKKPKNLSKLIEYAELIASKIDCFLRLDFYITKRGPVFGEFTTTPNAGGYINEGAIAFSQLMELFPDG